MSKIKKAESGSGGEKASVKGQNKAQPASKEEVSKTKNDEQDKE